MSDEVKDEDVMLEAASETPEALREWLIHCSGKLARGFDEEVGKERFEEAHARLRISLVNQKVNLTAQVLAQALRMVAAQEKRIAMLEQFIKDNIVMSHT
jgi:hypothetical protein